MDNLTAVAASGMRSRMQALELLANNLANASTRGFKSDREMFTVYSSADASNASLTPGQQAPWLRDSYTDFTQGTIESTDNALDVAISGPGFFTMQGASGNVYTRNGNFHLGPDGQLVGAENRLVLDEQNKTIRLDPGLPVTITPSGEIRQQGTIVAKLAVIEFANPDSLTKLGQSYFKASQSTSAPKQASGMELKQGALESSNATPSDAAVQLVSVMRQFEMLQKAISLGSEMNRKAIEELAKVNV